jgi:predicted dithiol-disulfide oxidoreductase (DUF899 family)
MKTTDTAITGHRIVSREESAAARKELLRKEKELTRLRDQLAAERRALPWVKIEKDYLFDAPNGKVTLRDLFDGRSQLFIKHFMMAPGQVGQCVGCSLEVDHLEGILLHLQNHDVAYAAVARAPIEEIEVVRKRMGWKFPWVSSYHSDFNYDFNVSFTSEQVASGQALYNYQEAPAWAADLQDLSGDSVFFKDNAGQIFHTYSTFGRGGEEFFQSQKPATTSFVSANGPSITVRFLPSNLTRAPLELGCSPSPASITPALVSSSLYFPIAVRSSSLGRTPASEDETKQCDSWS